MADLGFVGPDDDPDDHPVIITGRKAIRNHQLTDAERAANRLSNRERAAAEHGFANLKSWRCLTKVRPHEHPSRDHPPANPPRPGEHRGPTLTDDLAPMITPPTSTSTPNVTHTSSPDQAIQDELTSLRALLLQLVA
ncbi:hypothetical protein ACLVWQ_14720 [Streptomyces sp. CWNU-52B]|uniref:hypothetical protein n=1 Tax=Streptomyces sp. CWNU-52B TaxID=3394353 RepID=UPI0039BFB513